MATVKLSKLVADQALPKTGRYVLWDSELSGFGLRVTPAGIRTWLVKYRGEGGGRNAPIRWLTIGAYPTVPVAKARDLAAKALAAVLLGQDPAGDATTKRKELRIVDLIDLYEKDGLFVQRGIRIGTPMKPLTARYTMNRLRHHVVPLLGKKRITEVTEGDIEAFARAVAKGKTAKDVKAGLRTRIIVRGGEGAARKVVRDLSAVFSFAKRRRLVSANPVTSAGVRKTDNRRERYLSMDEVQRLGAALDELEAEGANPKAINIARLWALSGCRRNEIAGLRWSEVDLERGLLVLADSKTGRSVRPLGGAAVALLEALRSRATDDIGFVFPAERGKGFYQGFQQVWPVAVARADLPGVTPHVLRHTVGSWAASTGEALLMVGSMLGHSNARSTQIYAHIAYDPARLAADRITAPIAAALSGSRAPASDRPHANSATVWIRTLTASQSFIGAYLSATRSSDRSLEKRPD
jgi:integrase